MKIVRLLVSSILISIVVVGSAYAEDRVGLGFLYGSTENIDLIDRTNGAINQVSPTCFDLDDKGNLAATANLTHKFVEEMHNRGILVTPFLSNHWVRQKGRKALKNAEKLSDQIVAKIEEYDLDGVNVDIENLTEDDREALAEFVRILSEKLPEEKILSVSVAANPYGRDDGWQGSYDYQKLGDYSDYLFVMTYDEHSIGGAEGPVASNNFVEESIKYTLQFVSKDKIVLGIPFYGRYWEVNEGGGQAVVIGAVPSIISKHNGIVEYNEEIGETKVTFTVNNEVMPCKINGEELADGTYTIWYHTNKDIKAKLAMVNEYDLLGCGVWALGQERAEVWDYFKDELNKVPREEKNTQIEENIEQANEYQAIKELVIEIAEQLKDNRVTTFEIDNSLDLDNISSNSIEEFCIEEKENDNAKVANVKKETNDTADKKEAMTRDSSEKRKSKKIHFLRMEKVY